MRPLRIGLIGDCDSRVTAHRAIPLALATAGGTRGVRPVWIPTITLTHLRDEALDAFDALWCVPASPYASMEGALRGIRHARQAGIPFLGTCGGFQHAVIEYARNVLGLTDAEHEETSPDAGLTLVSRLSCSLVERTGAVRLREGSRARALYGRETAEETYHCSFGLNPAHRALLDDGRLRMSGEDDEGEARVLELDGHPFFVATLFQPERAALRGHDHPVVRGLVDAAAARADGTAT